jgi:hypothetical protein
LKHILLIFFLSLLTQITLGQETTDTIKQPVYVQFSGVVVIGNNLEPVPFVNIVEKKSRRGTSSDYYGFFSFVAVPGDTIIFSSIGYKNSQYIIPDSLYGTRYSLIQKIEEDTILLKEKTVYPWPSKEQFKEAFLNLDIPNDDLARAQANLSPEVLAAKQGAYPAGGGLNFKWQMDQVKSQLYYAGQAPPNHLLNPLAWAKFIKAWRNGDFKRKK